MFFADVGAYVAWKLWPVWVSIFVLLMWCLFLHVYVQLLGQGAASISSVKGEFDHVVSQVNSNFDRMERDRKTMRARILALAAVRAPPPQAQRVGTCPHVKPCERYV